MSGESRAARLSRFLSRDTTGGLMLLIAAALALAAANSPLRAGYDALRDLRVGPEVLHLDLTLGEWAADGLLAVFFFVVGLELKHGASSLLRSPFPSSPSSRPASNWLAVGSARRSRVR